MPSLRSTTLLSFTLGSLFVPLAAQAPTPAAPTPAPPTEDPRTEGLPKGLLLVPGGTVQVGLTAADLIRAACEAVSPGKPQFAPRVAPGKTKELMGKSASTLGRQKVMVETFLLGKTPVKNSEYEVFVKQMRAAGKRIRVPFHWWRYGRKDDYNEKLAAINQQFPKDPNGPINYWEQHGHELPYSLVDDRGQSIADQPVSYVSYPEAVAFAGWLGMRLPTEAEWTRAARADGSHIWPWGNSQLADTFVGEASLKHMRLYAPSDQKPLNIGVAETAVGPYGHLDMFGRIWQLMSGVGYAAVNGPDPFREEWKALQKDKVGGLLEVPPAWKDTRVIAKGGSYLSSGEPVQLLIDARAPLHMDDVLEGAGLRLAKSLQPGYDLLFSLVRGVYNRNPFALEQDVDLTGVVGGERYEVGADGFPTGYRAIALAPMNWLANEKGLDLGKILDRTHSTPQLIGTLAVTEALAEPAAPAGLYSVLYRKEGIPRELADAQKVGWKEVQAALKLKAKGGGDGKPEEAAPEEGKDDKDKKGKDDKKKSDWRSVLARYGLEAKDLEPKEAQGGLDFIRIDGVQVPTNNDCFLLYGNEGKVVCAIAGTNHRPALGKPFRAELTCAADAKGKTLAKVRFGVPLLATDGKRVVEFQLQVAIDCPPPTAAAPWRLPAAAAAAPAVRAPGTAANGPKDGADPAGGAGSAKTNREPK